VSPDFHNSLHKQPTNKTATRVINNIYFPKPKPLKMARIGERERGEESGTISTVSNWVSYWPP